MGNIKTKISQGMLVLLCFFIFIFLFILIVNFFVKSSVKSQIYDSLDEIPSNEYAVVLGTSRNISKSAVKIGIIDNPFYLHRLTAVNRLYRAGKVEKILLTGGPSRATGLDESLEMKTDLVSMGLDPQIMLLDGLGLRTLDSVLRSEDVFGLHQMTFVTQKFHCERALFIANFHKIKAVCFVAEDADHSLTVKMREYLAKVWMLFDLLRDRQARYPS